MGYLYRDLKPENILLHRTGHIMLADFDLSKPMDFTVTPFTSRNSDSVGAGYGAGKKDSGVSARTNSFVGTEEYYNNIGVIEGISLRRLSEEAGMQCQ